MKFSDLKNGDSFLFDGPDLDDDFRYVKVSEHGIQSYPPRGRIFSMNEEDIAHNVKNVGPAFEKGRELHFPSPESNNFVWMLNDQATGGNVTLEDVINAGYANKLRFSNMLVLPFAGEQSGVELVPSVKRIDKSILEYVRHHDSPKHDEISIIRLADGKFFWVDGKLPGGELEIDPIHTKPFKSFLANEARYADAKTLAEHEREYLAAKLNTEPDDEPAMSA